MDNKNIENFIQSFLEEYNAYQTYWNYEDGCVLIGCQKLYEVTGKSEYLDYILTYLSQRITSDGNIPSFNKEEYNIDSMNSGKILLFAYKQTGEEKYKKALDFHMEVLKKHPRCKCGNFWHKEIYPNQIWLDGLYMAQPLYMQYETEFNHMENYNDIINQFENVRKYMFLEDKGLYYHAYDEEKVQPWANKETGCSSNFWSRALGWWVMALVDTLDVMSMEIFEQYKKLEAIFKEAIKGVLPYLDDRTGMLYQVIDREDVSGNYLETSGSVMLAYAILKGCRMGILQKEKYEEIGRKIFEGICSEKLVEQDGKWHLQGTCKVAGLGPGNTRDGSIAYYLSEPVVADEAKAVGPFMMAYAEYLELR